MDIQSKAVTAALALFPVYTPEWITPVQPEGLAHGGIPQSAFTINGLEVVIDPGTGITTSVVAAYDVVRLYVNGIATNVAKTILPGEESSRFLLHLPPNWFVNGVNDIYYRVTRVSGNFDDSLKLTVLYHDSAPGYPAPAGMALVLPAPIVADGVGPEEATQGVLLTFKYSFARPYDQIRLDIGGWTVTFEVTDPAKPITLTLTAADFQQIGDSANTPIRFTVFDQLRNTNQSATIFLDIHANQEVLNPPKIVEAEANEGVLDVTALGTKNATIHGLLWTAIAVGQQVWLQVFGQKADGTAHNLTIWNGGSHKVNATWISQGFWPKQLPNSYVKDLGDGKPLILKFKVSMDKSGNPATATKFEDRVYTIKNVSSPPLTIDPSVLVLNGLRIITNGVPSGLDAIGNTDIRQALGGVGKLSYTSSSPNIVSADDNGKVIGLQNGQATITVTDEALNSVSYVVDVSNVWYIQFMGWAGQTYDVYLRILTGDARFTRITPSMLAVIKRSYSSLIGFAGTTRSIAWVGTPRSGDYAEAYDYNKRSWVSIHVTVDCIGMYLIPA
ncbi:hypothetical protein BK660_05535 [Pseudomonas brassicacearum]|uniref:BIG2 domain-containing protein n=1 Tax=Pseudomonas brassicacearum TaxID=930166 RepID=A0A423II74_9PSED|nr:Ig-like domain-containing protein [Pseudomonas brassicacearum]RON25124.1 hypothetical protein BK660_05535 [Pseudomonas brassicacearum]